MDIQLSSIMDAYSGGNTTSITGGVEESARRTSRSATTPTSQGDTVHVSQDAHLLSLARQEAQNAPDIRAEKIEQLRIQVAEGTYQFDSRRIAAGLLREEAGLFRS